MEAPGLHETNFNTQCYNDAIGLTSRWKVRFRQTVFSWTYYIMEALKAIKIIGNQNDGRAVFLFLSNTG